MSPRGWLALAWVVCAIVAFLAACALALLDDEEEDGQ